MCGIFCTIEDEEDEEEGHVSKTLWATLRWRLERRGPNHVPEAPITCAIKARGGCKRRIISLGASVLWLRGSQVVRQPVVHPRTGDILVWNGDVFQSSDGTIDVSGQACDTLLVSEILSELSDESIPRFFSNIRGPYAFMLFRRSTGSLFFGRDFFGRHSLLVGPTSIRGMHNLVVVTSVTAPKSLKCHELPALGIFHMNLTEPILDELGLFKWDNLCGDELGKVCDWDVRVLGNISSPVTLPKTLSNVQMNDLERSVIELRTSEEALKQMLTTDVWRVCIDEFESILRKAVRTRVEKQPHLCSDCIKMSGHVQCPHAKTGVLFSGGLDSSVLVALVDDILKRDSEPINLLNVAFQLPDGSFDAPDRKTALQALEELRQRNPERKYNFLEINVTKKELETARGERIRDLIYPSNTVLDDGIGCALWFAARGHGKTIGGHEKPQFRSSARVVLLGTGADEQLGGYSRHRKCFRAGGIQALADELAMEVSRISWRNLGRDNRIIADHGVAPRYPFLDEDVVNFLSSLPTERKMDLRLPRGLGEKLLLRLLAYRLGLPKTAVEPKRAIQFGSRIAKMENKKEKGHHMAFDEASM